MLMDGDQGGVCRNAPWFLMSHWVLPLPVPAASSFLGRHWSDRTSWPVPASTLELARRPHGATPSGSWASLDPVSEMPTSWPGTLLWPPSQGSPHLELVSGTHVIRWLTLACSLPQGQTWIQMPSLYCVLALGKGEHSLKTRNQHSLSRCGFAVNETSEVPEYSTEGPDASHA